MLRLNSALVRAKEPSFEQRCDVMDARHGHMGWIGTTADDCDSVFVTHSSQSGIPPPPISVDNRSRGHNPLHERNQTFCRHVLDSLKANTPNPTTIFFSSDDDNLLGLDLPPSQPFLWAADVGFVNLDYAREGISPRPHHSPAEFMEPRPSCLVAPKAKYPLQAHGTYTVLLAGYEPHCQKPHPQRFAGTLKDRPRYQRCVSAANPAPQPSRSLGPWFASHFAVWANESSWPSQPTNVVSTCLVAAKPFVNLLECLREINSRDWMLIFSHPSRLPQEGERRGYPLGRFLMIIHKHELFFFTPPWGGGRNQNWYGAPYFTVFCFYWTLGGTDFPYFPAQGQHGNSEFRGQYEFRIEFRGHNTKLPLPYPISLPTRHPTHPSKRYGYPVLHATLFLKEKVKYGKSVLPAPKSTGLGECGAREKRTTLPAGERYAQPLPTPNHPPT